MTRAVSRRRGRHEGDGNYHVDAWEVTFSILRIGVVTSVLLWRGNPLWLSLLVGVLAGLAWFFFAPWP